ncbi:unnamed protein product [Tuwongella immobilis]|uniref:Uncharacterized protein n=1 Tax=Tuwongella immobilis TaxID=692036 RepID=A0A6C2YI14_9BACT|nr:unnamed protein product [Tuwongella immobilis]VTR97782.1 unnamed protein product [Tuwongella immobilis]
MLKPFFCGDDFDGVAVKVAHDRSPSPSRVFGPIHQRCAQVTKRWYECIDRVHMKSDSDIGRWSLTRTDRIQLENEAVAPRCVVFWTTPVSFEGEPQAECLIERNGSMDIRRPQDQQIGDG